MKPIDVQPTLAEMSEESVCYSVSAMVVVFNEAATLREAVQELTAALNTLCSQYEIIIIDDCSSDGSGEIADDLAVELSAVSVIHHDSNQGMGGVYRTGLRAASMDIVSFSASDGQPIPQLYFERCLPALKDHDMAIGRLPNRKDPFLTLLFSRSESLLLQILFPGVPRIEGPFMFRRRILSTLQLELLEGSDRSWAVLIELLVKAVGQGRTFERVAVERRARKSGRSRGGTWRNAMTMALALLRLRLRVNGKVGSRTS
jgi:glycosyltransferase involved in cell wall biosynthesis